MSTTAIRNEQITSESATDGYVLTADGAGGAAWEAAAGVGVGAISVYNETQTGDGVNTIYYLANYAAPSTIRVFVDGVRQSASDDAAATDQVTFSTAPLAGSVLLFDYELELA